jgi:radical SAM protein with 4Fe4S-binding SPASM domain
MTESEFLRILEQLEGKTGYIYYHLMGEPLTHPCLTEFIRMAAERGFKSVITTNGTLLRAKGDALLETGVHKVSISLHSFEDGCEDSFYSYLSSVSEFADKAARKGTVTVLRLWNKGHDGGRNDAILEYLRAQLEGEWSENTRGYRVREKLFLEWGDRFEWPDMSADDHGCRGFCYGLRDQFGILCDGTVVPCCLDSDGVIALGNIFDEDIDEILSSPRARAIREGFDRRVAVEELCRRCGYARRFT